MSAIAEVQVDETPRRPFFTPQSLAAYLALSERTIRELLARGEIASYKVGANARRIDPSDVESWLQSKREGGHDG